MGQKRLTNVAVAWLRQHGQRFEIACFPHNVLDEVLKSYTITMIECLMHEIHFVVDPNLGSKEQVGNFPDILDCYLSTTVVAV